MNGKMREPEISAKSCKLESGRNVLDLTGKGIQSMTSLPKRYSICDLVLDNNSIAKIERLDAFPKLCLLSMVNNHLVRMNGINFAKNLVSVNLSNNGIVSMEGLCWLVHLEYLDLSKNNIKRIQNVSYCTKLKHMDLSENSISDISNLKNVQQLKVLLLHGNNITTLERAEDNIPEQIERLSLSTNGISDLNEVRHLLCLSNLKHFSIFDNPCVMKTTSLPGFEYRPFILSCVFRLLTLDNSAVRDSERQEAERLIQDENFSLFTFGHHLQLVLYLSNICPSDSQTKITKDRNNLLEKFLQKRRMEIFTNKQNTENARNGLALSNDVHYYGVADVKASDTLQSSSYSVLQFTNSTQHEREIFSPDEDCEIDTLRSESRFLPVYSPLKSPGRFQGSLSSEASLSDNVVDLSVSTDNTSNMTAGLPIMTEEEANKLIYLAATILQSHVRGFLVRRQFDYRKFKRVHTAASKIQALWRGYYFRNYSYRGLSFKNELRVKRLQKYISTLWLIVQKSEKQHETEKSQMLEIITLLYDKFTRLSEKVEGVEGSRNEGNKMRGNESDESRNSLERTMHPVFFPHPRLSKNIEQSDAARSSRLLGNVEYSVEVDKDPDDDIQQDYDSINYVKLDKVSDDVREYYGGQVDHSDFEVAKEDIVDKHGLLMNQECRLGLTEWDAIAPTKVGETEKGDTIMDQSGPNLIELDNESRLSKNSPGRNVLKIDTNCGSKSVNILNDGQDGTNEVVNVYERSEVPDDIISTDVLEDFTGKDPLTSVNGDSRTLTVENTCELFEDLQDKKKLIVLGTFGKDCQTNGITSNDVEQQFDNDDKQSCSNFEDDQELKRNTVDILIHEDDEQVLTNKVRANVLISVEEETSVINVKELDIVGKGEKAKDAGHEHKSSEVCEVINQRALTTDATREVGPIQEHEDIGPGKVVIIDKDELQHTTVEDKIVEDGASFDDADGQGEKGQQELFKTMLSDSSKQRTTEDRSISEEKICSACEGQYDAEDKNLEHKAIERGNDVDDTDKEKHSGDGREFKTFSNEIDGAMEASKHLNCSNAEATRVELSDGTAPTCFKIQEVFNEPQMTLHEPTDVLVDNMKSGFLKDSLDPIDSCSHEVSSTVDFMDESEESEIINEKEYAKANQSFDKIEGKISVVVRSNNESRDGGQNGDSEGAQSSTAKMDRSSEDNPQSEDVCGSSNLDRDTAVENRCETSPKLREQASSLLSALKDEITGGVISMSTHSVESVSTSHMPVSHLLSGEVGKSEDVEPGTKCDLSSFENQELTKVDEKF